MEFLQANVDPLALDETSSEETKAQEVASLWEHEALAQSVLSENKRFLENLTVQDIQFQLTENKCMIPIKVLRGHVDSVSSCQFCYNDTRVLTGSHDKTAIFWNVETGEQLMVLKGGHSAAITGSCLVADKNRVITSSWDRNVSAWDLETGKMLWTVTQGGLLTTCSVSRDGKLVASASDMEDAVYLNCAETGQRLHHLQGHHKSTVMSCRFDAQSQHLASVSADRSVKLWDLYSHRTTLTMKSAHTNVISGCCFTKDGRYLCTASWDRTLQLWDVQTGTFRTRGGVQLTSGHSGCVSSCAFSSDASILASGAYDKTVVLWDMKGLCKMLTLKGHSDWVTDVDISTDKNWVLSSSKDCTVRMWNIERVEHVPAVIETRRGQGGFQVLQCEQCGNSFSICRLESTDLITQCVFCRLKTPRL